jgi:hypothetical protein
MGAVGENVRENKTVENVERIFKAAKENGFEGFISPHYFFPSDRGWKFNGPLETDEAETHMFARSGRLSLDGFLASAPTGSIAISTRHSPDSNQARLVTASCWTRISDPDQRDFSSDKTFWR